MKVFNLTILALFLWVATSSAQWSDKLQFTARMDGAQAGVSTSAVGVATIMLNTTMDSMCIGISMNGLSGAVTAIHIHDAPAGMSGAVVADLGPFLNGNSVTGMLPVTNAMLNKMMTQGYYINAHTAANGGGEIRGQIKLETDWMHHGWADANQQAHTVMGANTPTGLATLHIGQNNGKANIRVIMNDLSGAATAAHLHYGAPGSAGGVAVNLTTMISGNTIMGSFDPMATADFMDSLAAGSIYLNVHTALNPSGEMRAQLMMNEGHLTFDSWLDTMQATNTVTGANPMGNGYVSINSTMDTLWYDFLLDGLSGTPTAAHIHNGMAGVAGGVLLNLSTGINGNRINGMLTSFTNANVVEILKGAAYVNVHTTTNGAGEARGQVYKHARDGYAIGLDGNQQSPAVTVNGMGAGMVSIDRDKTNAHVMMVLSDLTGALSAAHFHTAPMGMSGGVAYNLSPWFASLGTDDSAFGYWTDADATTPFSAAHASLFWNDSIYVNVHTAAHAGGEIRGQVTMNSACSQMAAMTPSAPILNNLSDKLQFTARMNGTQAGVSTTAVGVATMMLNTTMDSMCIDISLNGLSGAVTGIHIHDAPAGMSGGVVTDLGPFLNGNRVTGMLAVNQAMLSKMMEQGYYINVHTAANAGGEIRGQIKLETDWMHHGWADANQQTHTVMGSNTPTGLATLHISLNNDAAHIRVIMNDLSGTATAAHLHYGAPGSTGGVAVNLTPMISGNTIAGTFDPMMTADFMDSLAAGSIYLNVHTTMNPSGEMRAQLMMNEGHLTFDSWLDTDQQAHAVTGAAPLGNGYVSINSTMDTLWYDFLFDGLSGTPSAAHIHNGLPGVAGGVLLNLSTGISGNRINGMLTSFTSANVVELLKGATYVNVHTATNASGEARGQVYKHARDGYNAWLDGNQQVPAVSVSGTGAGMVSIDRYKTHAHVMMVVSDLTGALTGAHFHSAAMGANGGVEYNLSNWFAGTGTDDSAFGYWTAADATTPFTEAHATLFWNDGIYVNTHTAANPSGELRGQVTMNTACNQIMTGIENIADQTVAQYLEVFPNPASEQINIGITPTKAGNHQIEINNALGQTVMTKTTYLNESYQQLSFDLSELNNGIYTITIRTDKQQQTQRFIKF